MKKYMMMIVFFWSFIAFYYFAFMVGMMWAVADMASNLFGGGL